MFSWGDPGLVALPSCKGCFPPRVPEWQPGDKLTGRDPEAVRVIAERKRIAGS